MPSDSYAGYTLQQRLPASAADVARWQAEGPEGSADVFLGPESILKQARALPAWGPFPKVISGQQDGVHYVVVPGTLTESISHLSARLSTGCGLGLIWHVSAAFAELHEHGGAHGLIHPDHIGLDGDGYLVIRPAFSESLSPEPDPEASAQATDCRQLVAVLDALDIPRLQDAGLPLLMMGIRSERARFRLSPGRAVRQSLSAIASRNPQWEAQLVDALGSGWALDQALRPMLSISQAQPAIRPLIAPPPAIAQLPPATRPIPSLPAEEEFEEDVHPTLSPVVLLAALEPETPAHIRPARVLLNPNPTDRAEVIEALEDEEDTSEELGMDEDEDDLSDSINLRDMMSSSDDDDSEELEVTLAMKSFPVNEDDTAALAEEPPTPATAPGAADSHTDEDDAPIEALPASAPKEHAETLVSAPAEDSDGQSVTAPLAAASPPDERPDSQTDVPGEPSPEAKSPAAAVVLKPASSAQGAPDEDSAPTAADHDLAMGDAQTRPTEAAEEPEEAPPVAEHEETPEPEEAEPEEAPSVAEPEEAEPEEAEPEEAEPEEAEPEEAEPEEAPEPEETQTVAGPEETPEPEEILPVMETEETPKPDEILPVVETEEAPEPELAPEAEDALPEEASAPIAAGHMNLAPIIVLPVVPEDTEDAPAVAAAQEDDPVFDDVSGAFAALYTDEEVELVGDGFPDVGVKKPEPSDESAPLEDAQVETARSVVVVEDTDGTPEDEAPIEHAPDEESHAALEPESSESIEPPPVADGSQTEASGSDAATIIPPRPSFLRDEVPVDVIVPEPSFPKPVAPASPSPKLVMAPRSLELPRPASDDTSPGLASPIPRSPEPDPSSPDAMVPLSTPMTDEQPLWSGVKGVTNSSSRETELGVGKWTEPARSPEEIRQAFPSTPTRNMQLSDGTSNLPLYAAAALALLALSIFWLYQNNNQPAETFTAPDATNEVVEATPAAAMVQVQVLTGAQGEVIFEGVSYGMTPAGIPLPDDGGSRSLCLQFSDRSRCLQVTRAQLAANQVFLFDTSKASTP